MFQKYEYIYAIYEEGSFTRAAKKLFISQPSLSVAVKNIEKEIGAPLFERRKPTVTLTDVGKEYVMAAERIMSVEKDFQSRAKRIIDKNNN